MTEQYQRQMTAVADQALSLETPVPELESWKEWRKMGQLLTAGDILEPVEYLIRLCGLNEFEQFCLLFLVEAEIDGKKLVKKLGQAGFEGLSPLTMMSLFEGRRCFDQELFASFLKGGRLAGWIMAEADRDGPAPSDLIQLDGRIRNLILGDSWEDRELEPYGFWIYPQDSVPGEMKGTFGEKEYRQWSRIFRTGKGTGACVLKGPEGIGKKTQVRRYVREYDCPVFCMDISLLEEMLPDTCQRLLKRIVRECRIQQAVLCVEQGNWKMHRKTDGPESDRRYLLTEQLRRMAEKYLDGFLMLQSGEENDWDIPDPMIPEVIPMPSLREAAEIWKEFMKEFPCDDKIRPEEFAGVMAMTPGQIGRVFALGESFRKRDGCPLLEERHLKEACRSLSHGKMSGKAVRVKTQYTFEDLILPEKQKRLLKEACSQVKNRYRVYEEWGFGGKNAYGNGISVVFSGSPGTGKTMAAQVMAGELGLELYKVDLSAVVSKYIGETEKNLNLIFDEGRKNQAVLFFDEADVLFSKRTEVRDSHDKYSNMEAAFLLQKMEEYTGVAILATNYIQNMDEAFKRRLTYMIEFPSPDEKNRMRLWESMVPSALKLDDNVDFEFLAREFELSGSQIKNSLMNAAFLAAETGVNKVGMKHLLRSVEKEMQKSGRKLTTEDMGEYGHLFEGTEGGT